MKNSGSGPMKQVSARARLLQVRLRLARDVPWVACEIVPGDGIVQMWDDSHPARSELAGHARVADEGREHATERIDGSWNNPTAIYTLRFVRWNVTVDC